MKEIIFRPERQGYLKILGGQLEVDVMLILWSDSALMHDPAYIGMTVAQVTQTLYEKRKRRFSPNTVSTVLKRFIIKGLVIVERRKIGSQPTSAHYKPTMTLHAYIQYIQKKVLQALWELDSVTFEDNMPQEYRMAKMLEQDLS